jgi:hypothetical protein
MKIVARLAVIAAIVFAAAIAGGPSGAATTPAPAAAKDTPPLPPLPVAPDLASQLTRPHFEMPPLDPDADIQSCAVCRLAAATTGRLPNDAFRIESEMIERGATLRLLSSDPSVRDTLWRATLARGQVLAALRAESGVHLCTWCRERREMLTDLEISARRIPEGVMLVYTSPSPAIVRQIQTAVRAGSDVPL